MYSRGSTLAGVNEYGAASSKTPTRGSTKSHRIEKRPLTLKTLLSLDTWLVSKTRNSAGPRAGPRPQGRGQGPGPRARAKGQRPRARAQGQGRGPRARARAQGRGQGPQGPMFPNLEKLFSENVPKIMKYQFWGENQSCPRRNSAHFGTNTVPWGPSFDSFPDFQFVG